MKRRYRIIKEVETIGDRVIESYIPQYSYLGIHWTNFISCGPGGSWWKMGFTSFDKAKTFIEDDRKYRNKSKASEIVYEDGVISYSKENTLREV